MSVELAEETETLVLETVDDGELAEDLDVGTALVPGPFPISSGQCMFQETSFQMTRQMPIYT
jgi:hypothetical protein